MSDEMPRRSLYIRLNANSESPHLGREYRHELPQWAKVHRSELVWACLTICQAWVAAGKPRGRKLLGKYEAWSAVIDGILCNAGIDGLSANADKLREDAQDNQDDWGAFVEVWWERHHDSVVTVRELFPLAAQNDMLMNARGDKSEESQRSHLGRAIKKQRDTIFNSLKITSEGKNRLNGSCYRLVPQEGREQKLAYTPIPF